MCCCLSGLLAMLDWCLDTFIHVNQRSTNNCAQTAVNKAKNRNTTGVDILTHALMMCHCTHTHYEAHHENYMTCTVLHLRTASVYSMHCLLSILLSRHCPQAVLQLLLLFDTCCHFQCTTVSFTLLPRLPLLCCCNCNCTCLTH
jgi:hypothetical protein